METQTPKLDLCGYENKWVALTNDENLTVVAAADTVEGVIEKAAEHGESDPVLVKAPCAASVVY